MINTQSSGLTDKITLFKTRIQSAMLPPALTEKLLETLKTITASNQTGGTSVQMEQTFSYLETILALPWNTSSADNLEISHAKEMLDKNHYGMQEIKTRIIEYLSVLKLQKQQKEIQKTTTRLKSPILCFVGLVGTGKTTLAGSIAETLGRSLERIPFGGMGSASELRGTSRIHSESSAGLVIKSMMRAKYNNPVLLLDEIDRVSDQFRSDIMGVLVELLDAEQNFAFMDYYIDYPFDLSNVLFVATANNTKNIATAVLDRLEVIHMPSYSDTEKTIIAKQYILPKEIIECGLTIDQLVIDEQVWAEIVRPLGFDAGMRTMQRTVNGICRKTAMKIVSGESGQVHITTQNVKEFLPTDI